MALLPEGMRLEATSPAARILKKNRRRREPPGRACPLHLCPPERWRGAGQKTGPPAGVKEQRKGKPTGDGTRPEPGRATSLEGSTPSPSADGRTCRLGHWRAQVAVTHPRPLCRFDSCPTH